MYYSIAAESDKTLDTCDVINESVCVFVVYLVI